MKKSNLETDPLLGSAYRKLERGRLKARFLDNIKDHLGSSRLVDIYDIMDLSWLW